MKNQSIAVGLTLILTASAGCAAGYRATYGAGAITKEFVTQAHEVYSQELNERFDECDPRSNPESTVLLGDLESLNECMGDGYTKDDATSVLQALAAYVAASEVLSAVLLEMNSGREERRDAWVDVLEAALETISYFPEAREKADRLKHLLGRMGR